MEAGEVLGAQFRMYTCQPGFIRLDFLDGAEVSRQDAHEVLQALESLVDGRSLPLLVDLRKARSLGREARKEFARSAVPSRVAIFVESSLSRMVANFYIGVSGPSVPTKLFSDLDAAQRWLLDDR